MANTINDYYLKVKNSCCVCREFLTFNADINLIRRTISESDLFLYTRNLQHERLKPVFECKITFWICVLMLRIHKGYCLVKKLVGNVRIKAFWYTKRLLIILHFRGTNNIFVNSQYCKNVYFISEQWQHENGVLIFCQIILQIDKSQFHDHRSVFKNINFFSNWNS